MSNQPSIKKLSLPEKIQLMGALWDDLSASPDYTPPTWHGDELGKKMPSPKAKPAIRPGEKPKKKFAAA